MELWIYIFIGAALSGMLIGGVIGHAIGHRQAINRGWDRRDSVDYETLLGHEESI